MSKSIQSLPKTGTLFGFPVHALPASTVAEIEILRDRMPVSEFAEFEELNSRPVGVWVPVASFVEEISAFFSVFMDGADFEEFEDGSAMVVPVVEDVAPVAPVAVAPVVRRAPRRFTNPRPVRRRPDVELVTVTKNGEVRKYRQSAKDVRGIIEDGYRRIASEISQEKRDPFTVEEILEIMSTVE